MTVRENRDIRPLLLKFGVALALSFAGFLYSRLRTRRIRPSQSPPSPPPSDYGNQVDQGGRGGLKDDLHALQTTPSSCNSIPIAAEKYEEACLQKVTIDDSMVGLSPSSKHSRDRDRFPLPEFNELAKEFDFAAASAGISPRKDVETPKSDVETPKSFRSAEKDDYEQEIKNLRNMVRVLRERERNLEIQLLEYYGLKEQETAVMELQNRLKINNMEAKLYTLKIESLQADKGRLEAQVADYGKVVAELEAARAKIKLLKKKLRFDAEHNKEQILILQQRVANLQDQEHKAAASNPDIKLKLHRIKELEEEAEELRKFNLRLQQENSELARRLESTQILATAVLEDAEGEALKEVSQCLGQENDKLAKELEQLQADRCVDVEELVYLRWINACLRYELRNYQPQPGKTVARDLSKTLSPKSEEKAKQLILEYANTEGMGEKGINIMDFDSDQWSSSHASYLTDSGEFDDSSVDNSAATQTNTSSKMKIFSKLRRLIRGKDSHNYNLVSSVDKTASLEEVMGTYDCDSPRCSSSISTVIDARTDGHSNTITTPSQSSSRPSLAIQRLRSLNAQDTKDLASVRRNSDLGSSCVYKRIVLGGEGPTDWPKENRVDQYSEATRKSELVKYAEVLQDSRGGTPKLHRKSASCSSY